MATGGKTGPTATGGLVPYSPQWWAVVFQQSGFNPYAAGPSPLPLDPGLQAQQDLIGRQYGSTIAGLDAQRQSTIKQFGLDDPSDPFSRAALLQKSYENNVRGTTNSMASRGQLYAGSLVNAQNQNALQNTQARDSLRKQQDSLLAQIEQRRAQAGFAKEQGNLDALQQSTANAAQAPLDTSTVSLPGTPTGLKAPTVPKPPSVRSVSIRRRRTRHVRPPSGGRLY